ncbi:MAG: tRNA (pseudouridine(54)-N(1))-methyltransferase TrmY [Candidatus Aenigmarchaeota archaeon]|nr:tRNA (pseudouridine(54)-N(1))-methyltransferase TrmY [Candidatus Aenigmarchaeota archaeon]
MREFILRASKAVTTPDFNLNDLPGSAGRMDLVCRCISSALWISNDLRRDSRIFVVLEGPPFPPKLLIFDGRSLKGVNPDERNIASHIKKALRIGLNLKLDQEIEVSPGIKVVKRSFESLIKEKVKEMQVLYLHPEGKDIKEIEIKENVAFIVGDHVGIARKTEKLMERLNIQKVSLGKVIYLASHAIVITNYELDRRWLK